MDWTIPKYISSLPETRVNLVLLKYNIKSSCLVPPLPCFSLFKLPDICSLNLKSLNIIQPTSIQMQCIPLILLNHNLLVLAPDSCGQTVCFGLPILLSCYNQKYHNIIVGLRIIVCSNRESVQSTFNVLKSLNVYNLKIASCVGSLNVKDEFDIVIGTPGRLIDYLTCIKTSLGSLSSLVINRADELVDRGYQEDLKHILSMFKTCMQTILFANSMSDKLDRFLDSILKQKTIVKCNYRNSLISRSNQKLEYVKQDYRLKYLYECVSRNTDSFLIIALNIREAEEITAYLVKKEADALSIKSRDALSMFKNGKLTILVATHSILKDIDFPILNLINYEVPSKKEYIERLIKAKDANVTTIVNRFSRDENMNDMKMLYQEFGISIPVFLQEFGVVGGEWEKCMKA